jgi:hypothetical protein
VVLLVATPARAADEPRIRSIQPAVVERGVGTDVVVEGTNLWPVEDVTVNRADVSVSVASSGNSPTRLRLHVTTSEASKPGPMRLTVKTKSGTATSDRLSVRLRSPTVSKVTPNELSRGRTYDVVVAGANLALKGSETKTSVPAPMTVARGEASTDRQLLAKVGVPPEAPLGPSAITIETEDGKVSAPFTVVASPPSVESVEPGRVVRGVPATLRVAGENLTGATAMLAVPDAGVVVAPDGPSGPDGFSVRVQAAANAVPGSRTLVVLTADGTASVRFDVVVEPPVLERVAPAGAPRGTTTEVRVTGRGVPADAPIRVVPADPALRLESGSAGKPPRLSSDPAAVPGTRTLLVTTPQGALLAPFQVTLHPPHVSGIAPTEGAPGTTAEVTVEGTSLGDASWSVVPADGSVTVEPAGPGKLRVVVAPGARAGPRTLVARNRDGFAATLFSVTGSAPAAPVVSSVEPARVARRGPARVVVRGQNLAGESVVVEGEGGARIEAKVAEATSTALALDLATGPQTPLGAYLVRVETPGGGGAVVLEVAGDPPSVASVSPERTTRPFAGEVVLRGRALVEPDGSAPKVEVARADGGGALAAKVVSAAPEEVRLRLEVGADAPTGELIVSVATADGGAAALLAVDPRPPAVSSLAPPPDRCSRDGRFRDRRREPRGARREAPADLGHACRRGLGAACPGRPVEGRRGRRPRGDASRRGARPARARAADGRRRRRGRVRGRRRGPSGRRVARARRGGGGDRPPDPHPRPRAPRRHGGGVRRRGDHGHGAPRRLRRRGARADRRGLGRQEGAPRVPRLRGGRRRRVREGRAHGAMTRTLARARRRG